jgi:hypothetical protein
MSRSEKRRTVKLQTHQVIVSTYPTKTRERRQRL